MIVAAHLDLVQGKAQAGELWVAGPTPVLRYRRARETCALPSMIGGRRLHFAPPSADCRKHATMLTFVVRTADLSDPDRLQGHQAGVALAVRKLGPGRFAVDADPTKGDAALTE